MYIRKWRKSDASAEINKFRICDFLKKKSCDQDEESDADSDIFEASSKKSSWNLWEKVRGKIENRGLSFKYAS